jgi:HD-like signal output (HDOD) protein
VQKSSNPPPTEYQSAFDFIRSLAGELSGGKVDLPSFPEVAVRVRRILADPKSSVEQVVRVVGSEPALAARLMRIANSASLNRSGKVITELRTAISRIGYNMVRSASISFAMAQIRNSNKLAGLEHYLQDVWQRSTKVAAFAYVLAKVCTRSRINPDEAMLTGMMHGIGKLYVITRSAAHPELFANTAVLDEILEQWHPSIGKAILENWEFSEPMAQAVGEQNELDRAEPEIADLSDVLAIAVLMAQHGESELEQVVAGLHATLRLGLNEARMTNVLKDSAKEISALSEALGA